MKPVTVITEYEDFLDNLTETISKNQCAEVYATDESFDHAFGTHVAWGVELDAPPLVVAFPGGSLYDVLPTVTTEVTGGGCRVPDDYAGRHYCGPACDDLDVRVVWTPGKRELVDGVLHVTFDGEIDD